MRQSLQSHLRATERDRAARIAGKEKNHVDSDLRVDCNSVVCRLFH